MDDILVEELQKLIGRTFEYEGIGYQVIEVLAEGHVIVLCRQNSDEVQMDQFGEPRRHCHKTYMVPLLSDADQDLHPLALALLSAIEAETIRKLLSRA
jgi:hypothetical protein